MKIILDTNIIVNNYYLNSPKFIGLFGYLNKTRSKLILQNFVFDEVRKKYKEEIDRYCKQDEKDNRILFNKVKKNEAEDFIKAYDSFLVKFVSDKKISVVKGKNISSKKLFERALRQTPPFDSVGRGFRDTLIWLSVVDMVKSNPTEYFCFITANTKDFGSENLLLRLQEDLGEDKDRLIYFNSLAEFLSEYGDKISFINEKFLHNFFWFQDSFFERIIDVDNISNSAIDEIPSSYDIDSIEDMTINNVEIDDFYIYSATKKFYKVQVEVLVTLELDVVLYDPDNIHISDTATVKGFSSSYVEVSLLINRETKEIEIDESIKPSVSYPL